MHEVGVGHVLVAVGKRQACGLVVEIQPVGAGQRAERIGGAGKAVTQLHGGGVGVLQNAQDLRDSNRARTGRREAAHVVGACRELIVGAEGRALLGLVGGQIGHCDLAGGGRVAVDLIHDGLGDLAFQ
ncbi:hypothetical protein SDC9_131448 [bioreactor metagenome]|uniref:Uncharacterized protein n=1 Tax=bioreactor metagenome TaxID=1076179 RepID=A0A645D594_9ZZZZ